MNIAPYIFLVTPRGERRSARLKAFVDAVQRTQKLALLRDEEDLVALGASGAPCTDLANGGLIWGHLFANESSRPISRQAPTDDLSAPATDFVRRHWGGYLAVRRRPDGIEVLRDPAGGIPCYTAEIDGTHVMTSRPALLCDAGLQPIEFDWMIVAQALAYRDIKPARTALRGISELLPGMSMHVRPDRVETRCVWSPWQFAGASDEFGDFAAAADELRQVLSQTVSTWAGCFRQPVVEISGGLDSAVVAACLAQSGRDPACLNFWPTAGDPDERPFARAIAERLKFSLNEVPLDVANIDLAASHAKDLPRASARTFSQAMDRATRSLGVGIGADVYFSGTGGDCVFCHLHSALPVVDRYLRQGIGAGLWRTAENVAHLAPATIWEVASSTVRLLRRRQHRSLTPRRNRFLAPVTAAALTWPAGNPWLDIPEDVLPGKRRHISSLISIQNHLEGYSRLGDGPIISPLLAQPVMELCIRIPTWLWCDAGRNRAVARAAFADALPAAVIARRSKGGFDSFGAELIRQNRKLMRDMLLDGALADQRLIDTAAVRQALERPLPDGEAIVELLALIDQEAWISAWMARRASR
ncbi:asparagine synthase-related protein [Sphingomonas sp. RT2P30]|uniref:asparagine synthase-related protein n=1 Tax=Parasphingomonas halimpatiens TaxID=3096162 RepID=UPI002FC75072